MILDAIIALFVSLFEGLIAGVSFVFVPLVNLLAAGVETIVGIFVSGFQLGRLKGRKRRGDDGRDKPEPPDHPMALWWSMITAILIFGGIVLAPKAINRKVTLVAKDGHSLPFSALIIHSKKGDSHSRTDHAGNITIPRLTTTGITIKDPRYIERRWSRGEIDSQLVVQRTMLGASLDSMADRLLKPAK